MLLSSAQLIGQVALDWSTSTGQLGYEAARSIAVDANGNAYTIGEFYDLVDFDHGSNVSNLSGNGYTDIFVQKLEANGDFVLAISIGGTGLDKGQGVAVDQVGNVYLAGTFEGTVDFEPGVGVFTCSNNGLGRRINCQRVLINPYSGRNVCIRKFRDSTYAY